MSASPQADAAPKHRLIVLADINLILQVRAAISLFSPPARRCFDGVGGEGAAPRCSTRSRQLWIEENDLALDAVICQSFLEERSSP